MPDGLPTFPILGTRVAVADYQSAADALGEWSSRRESRMVCFCNVHMVITARDSREFGALLAGADLVLPDGMPLVWVQRLSGLRDARRVASTDLTHLLLQRAADAGVRVGFLGGSEATLTALVEKVKRDHPGLAVAYAYSPPYRALTAEEDQEIVRDVNAAGVGLLFVGLGCPKQERWISAHRPHVSAVMLGIGATFDWLAGTLPRAPRWMRDSGLEWAFRLASEPGRLWRRYLSTNPRFVMLAARQVLGAAFRRVGS